MYASGHTGEQGGVFLNSKPIFELQVNLLQNS